jgi:hypothetical protein
MSRKYVRDMARAWIQESAEIPYYDTINIEEDPQDPFWCTIEFSHEYTDLNTYCNSKEEHGVIDIIVSGQPGTGDDDVMEYATNIVNKFMNNRDPSGKLTLLNDQAPEEFSGGDANKYYQVTVGVEYLYLFN